MTPSILCIERASSDYPRNIECCLGVESPAVLHLIGDRAVLDARLTALYCSSKCPGDAIVKTYDLAQRLRAEGRTVVSGFHSPMEKACLDILLRSPHSVVLCPARGLGRLRIRQEWKRPLAEGRLLILSPFPLALQRGTAASGQFRNRLAAALSDEILIAHAAPESRIARLADEVATWGKPVTRVS